MSVTCPYCNSPAEVVNGLVIYPHRPDLKSKTFWLCRPCDAYVGCHAKHPVYSPAGATPLGTLANPLLRELRRMAHDAFDPLWKVAPFRNRKRAYNWLAHKLDIPVHKCHIAMFDNDMCKIVCRTVADFMANDFEQLMGQRRESKIWADVGEACGPHDVGF